MPDAAVPPVLALYRRLDGWIDAIADAEDLNELNASRLLDVLQEAQSALLDLSKAQA